MINAIQFRSDVKDVATAASARLVFSIHVLERGSLQNPGIRKVSPIAEDAKQVSDRSPQSVEVIKQHLRAPAVQPIKRRLQTDFTETSERPTSIGNPGITYSQSNLASASSGFGESSNQAVPGGYASAPWQLDNSSNGPLDTIFQGISDTDDTLSEHFELFASSKSWPTPTAAPASGGGVDLLQGMLAMPSSWNTANNASWDDWNFEAWQNGEV